MANKKSSKKATTNATPSIADQPTQKKIGFFAAMFIVMGSSIGAGIFFKAKGVLESSQGSLVMAILAWLVAAFAVIAMALALVEIASARNDNLSLIGWCKVFCSRSVYKASKNFMAYIYLPLTYFFMPFYVIMSLQDAIGGFTNFEHNTFMLGGTGDADWVIWFLISLAISAFFIFVSGMSSRAGNYMNMGIMCVKFIPLAATIILGFVIAAMDGTHVQAWTNSDVGAATSGITQKFDATKLGFMSPGIGLFMAVGAIFFAYDGFYVTAGIQTEMKQPEKTPMAIVFGLGTVTIIYLLIAISMSLGGNGGLFGFTGFLEKHNAMWVFGLINLTVAIGVLGIINGFAMWAPRFVEDLIKENELPFSQKYMNKLNSSKPMVGIWYCVVITVPVVLVFTLIGAYGYYADPVNYAGNYGSACMEKLYTFCDLTGTWTAVFAFMFIMLPIAGGLKNRKEKWVKTDEKKYFTWAAWVSVVVISIVLAFLFLDAFVNVFILMNWDGFERTAAGAYSQDGFVYAKEFKTGWTDEIVARVMKLVTLFIFVGLMVIPTAIEDKLHIKKYGSIEKYESALKIEPCLRK